MSTQAQRKKILYVITKSNWGGAQRYVFDLAINFSKKYEVSVAFGGDGELKTKLENARIRTIQLPFLKRNINLFADISIFKKLIKLFKEEKPDIIHLNSSKIGIIGALAGRIAKVPKIIFTAHGWAFNEDRGGLSRSIFWFLHGMTVLLSHQTIAVSRATERDIKSVPFTKKKIVVIKNGIEKFPFKKRQEARSEILSKEIFNPLSLNIFWIGTISELHTNKGLEYAIRAMAKLKTLRPDFRFIFTVIGEGEMREYLENLIKELKLEQTVFLVGHKENASSLLQAFDVFLLSSVTEALGFVILEAGMAKLPVVASGVGGIPEIINDMESGILVRPRNPDEIAKALDFLIFQTKKSHEFGKNLYTNISENFSLKKMIEETTEVYKK